MILLLLLTLLLSSNVASPSAFPLAVRSPYLNCWIHHGTQIVPYIVGQTWPTTANRSQILGWSVLVRVDGLTYSFLGNVSSNLVNGSVNSTALQFGPAVTIFLGQAGPMQVNLTFFSPIEPENWVKQSIPFSYLSFDANSLDNKSHAVQVYSDVSGEWNSGDRTQKILWQPTYNSDVVFHSVTLLASAPFMEIQDQAQWGTLYYAMKAGDNVTFQISSDVDSRSNFTRNGTLNGQQDRNSRPIDDNFPAFAISRDLGSIQATNESVVWAIGYTTDLAINYSDLSGAPPIFRRPYYKIQYSNDEELASIYGNFLGDNIPNIKVQIVDFLNDFSNATSRAQQPAGPEGKIFDGSISISNHLSALTSVAIADVYGSMQLTIGTDKYGNLNKSDAMMFMKNIGGAKKNRVNAVETLYAAFPALMFLDPSLGAPLLEPLFRLQTSRNYTIKYAAADLGSNYPNVSGRNSSHSQGVEQTGNMLIMTYAYARASGDGSLISRYYSLLSSWADYLDSSTLFVTNQASADNLAVNNQTNLAIKGIIAIQAMSKMASVVNRTDDVYKYTNASQKLYTQWKGLALSSDNHLLAAYGQTDSWSLGYNLFADVWLGTNLVESLVYDGQSNFIENFASTSNFSTYGMPIDDAVPTNPNIAVSCWSSFVAAMTTNQGLRSELIERLYKRMNLAALLGVFPVYYDSLNGTSLQGVGFPAQGAVFAPLALKAPVQTINPNWTNSNLPSPKERNRNTGAISGGIIAGVVAVLSLIGIATFVQHRRRRRRSRPRSIFSTDSVFPGPQMIVTPFDPNSSDANQDFGNFPEQQPLVFGDPDTPAPVGLTDKEMARWRSEARSSPEPHNLQVPASNMYRSTPPPNVVTESGESVYDPRRLHTEFVSLRREVEQLQVRTEGLIVGAPPSYAEGDG